MSTDASGGRPCPFPNGGVSARTPRVTSPTNRLARVLSPTLFLVSALGLAACGAPPAPAVVIPAPTAAAVPAPDPEALKQKAAEELAAKHAAKVEAALARVPAIAQAVAEIRHLPLKHPVPAVLQSQDDFRKYLETELLKEMPPEKTAQSVRALVRLGFLKQSIDLGKTVEDAMLSQAGAYYDPDTKKFYVVLVPDDPMMLDVMSAHELTHALDDQYFDLGAYTNDPTHSLTNDVQQARRMVAEGEATLVMIAYQARVAAHVDLFEPAQRMMRAAIVAQFAAMDPEKLAKEMAASGALVEQMGPSLKASLDAMSTIPPFILDPLFSAYTKGALAIDATQQASGWDGVGKLYTDPPESTEQLLHPRDKLVAKRDHPVAITFPPARGVLKGLAPLDTDVVGELTMETYFRTWGDPTPEAEVLGWGGDRYVAYDAGGKVIAAWLTTWDTEKDATRFAAAYQASLGKRFPGETVGSDTAGGSVQHRDGTATTLKRSGKDVLVVEGATPAELPAIRDWALQSKRTRAK